MIIEGWDVLMIGFKISLYLIYPLVVGSLLGKGVILGVGFIDALLSFVEWVFTLISMKCIDNTLSDHVALLISLVDSQN